METLDLTRNQIYGGITTLQRRGLQVYGDGQGHYTYDPDRPVEIWPGSTPSNREPNPNLAETLYEILESNAETTARGDLIVRGGTARIIKLLPPKQRAPFLHHGLISQTLIIQCHQFLASQGCLELRGPIKYLRGHPTKTTREQRDEAARNGTRPLPRSKQQTTKTTKPTTILSEPWPTRAPANSAVDLVKDVDPDTLAHAVANGMWVRYEWLLGQLGEAREQIATLEERVKNREDQLARLQPLALAPEILDIARELLFDPESR